MPLIKIQTSADAAENKRDEVLAAVSKAVAEVTGKPERYMMVTLDTATIMFAGKTGPGAFVDVRGIGGLNPEPNVRLSKEICRILNQQMAIPADRVYLNFTDVPATHWGWNGKTFA